MKKSFLIPVFGVFCAGVFSGCSGDDHAVHTYWRQNPSTGFYVRHRTLSPLSPEEMRELGLIGQESLPKDAKTTD